MNHSENGKQYRALLRDLLRERDDAGGELPVTVESRYHQKLDKLWDALERSEQIEIERERANGGFGFRAESK